MYIIAMHIQGKILPETYEAVSFAQDLGSGQKTIIVLGSGSQLSSMANELSENTGIDVVAIKAQYLNLYNAESYKKIIKGIIGHGRSACICMPHVSMGYDLAPGLAVDLDAACITGIEAISPDASFTRSMFGGKIRVQTRPLDGPVVLTVLPGAWKGFDNAPLASGSVDILSVDEPPLTTRTLEIKASTPKDMGFSDAEVIVSAGRGIGSAENLLHIEDLAALFPRSAVGATRGVCDLGWLGYKHQIGVTGNTVAPGVYIACGISGAVQHLSGMRHSGLIIAINTDAHASIFRIATYCIVEDVNTFIPILLEEYKGQS